MDSNAHLAAATPDAAAAVDIDALEVSDRWKTYFKAVHKYGGVRMPLYKQVPKEERKAVLKELQGPMASTLLAFLFGFFYYLAKGMWKKGLVLLAIVVPVMVVISTLLYFFVGEGAANATRFLGGAVFAFMAPRDFYSTKVLGDTGWLPVRPF